MESLSQMKVEEIIFDSQIDDWKQYTSEFEEKIFGQSKISIMICDTNGNIFGVYINEKID